MGENLLPDILGETTKSTEEFFEFCPSYLFPFAGGYDIMADEELGKLAVPVSMDGVPADAGPFKTIWILIGIGD